MTKRKNNTEINPFLHSFLNLISTVITITVLYFTCKWLKWNLEETYFKFAMISAGIMAATGILYVFIGKYITRTAEEATIENEEINAQLQYGNLPRDEQGRLRHIRKLNKKIIKEYKDFVKKEFPFDVYEVILILIINCIIALGFKWLFEIDYYKLFMISDVTMGILKDPILNKTNKITKKNNTNK